MSLKGTIVFASGKSADFDVWRLNLESEEMKQLTYGEWWNDHPRWSPDGQKIVYVSNKSGVPELWLMNEDGTDKQQLTRESKFHSSPVWSPDGKWIFCCANYENADDVDVWAIAADGSGNRERIISAVGAETSPAVSPDGKKVLVSSAKSGNHDLWEVDLPTGEWRQITFSPSRDYCGAYSPDGEWIAYVSQPEIGATTDIWAIDTKCTRQPIRLTENKGTDNDVSWSPDGKHLVYCASGTANEGRIRIMNIETGMLENFSYDRRPLEQEIGAEVKDFGIFSELTPDFIQRLLLKFFDSPYFGLERYPHWKL